MSLGVYGRLFVPTQLEEAVIAHLKLWLPAYIAEVERQQELDPESIPMIRSYGQVDEFFKWPEDRLPSVIVICPGLAPVNPSMKGDGTYHAWYRVGVAIVAGGRDREGTRRLSRLYAAAMRGAITQHQSLGDFDAEGVRWTNERSGDIPDEEGRTLGSTSCTFDVEVKDVTNARKGPLTPPDDPYVDEDWPPEPTDRSVTVTTMED